MKSSIQGTINDEKLILKSSSFALHKFYMVKNFVHLIPKKCCVTGAPWTKKIPFSLRGAAWTCTWVSGGEFNVKFTSVKLKRTSMIQKPLYFRNTICIMLRIQRTLRINQFDSLDMEFAKWQIKIKKRGLGHPIPWQYNV